MGVDEPLLGGDPNQCSSTQQHGDKPVDQVVRSGVSVSENQKTPPIAGASCRPPRTEPVRRVLAKILRSNCGYDGEELRRFQRWLFFLGLDQSTKSRHWCSWTIFLLLTIVIPSMSWVFVSCKDCDFDHSHPFQLLVDWSESTLGAVSFLCLTNIIGKYGLKKVLLLDKLSHEALPIRCGYEKELRNSLKLLMCILSLCFTVELVHKVWWFTYVSVEVPLLGRNPGIHVFFCAATLVAWLYKSSVYLFVCVLFRLMCSLQLLRLEGYIKLLEDTIDVSTILREHMRIRDQLLMISHRYRVFLILSMLTITFSQLTSLFVMTDSRNVINFFRAGDLAVCSVVQLGGFVLCLHGAAKITHRAQRIMSFVSQWHAVSSCSPSAMSHSLYGSSQSRAIGPAHPLVYNRSQGDLQSCISVSDLRGAINVSERITQFPHSLASKRSQSDLESAINAGRSAQMPHDIEAYHQRQALMDYLQFANAGISLYGFVLDRGFLFAVFGLEFSLTLFILGKTILTN